VILALLKLPVHGNVHCDWYSRVQDEFITEIWAISDIEILLGHFRGVQDRTPPLQVSSLKQVPKEDPCSL